MQTCRIFSSPCNELYVVNWLVSGCQLSLALPTQSGAGCVLTTINEDIILNSSSCQLGNFITTVLGLVKFYHNGTWIGGSNAECIR
jgi:hypothetical protein